MNHGPTKVRQALLALVTGLLAIAFLEGALDVAALASARVATLLAPPWEPAGSGALPDARLGYRGNPGFPGHDRNGFRNPAVPAQADVVVFGDSQTYGTGVPAEAAWPSRLRELSGRSVYGIALGGFCPVHSLLLWGQALRLHPKVIVEAIYAGNDLFDAFNMVYNRAQLPGLKSPDADLRSRAEAAEKAEPLARHVYAMFNQTGQDRGPVARPAEAPAGFSFKSLIANHSGLYGVARRAIFLYHELGASRRQGSDQDWQDALAYARAHAPYCQVYASGKVRTIFTSEYRLAGLDQEDPRIAEGERVLFGALDELHRRAAAAGIRFVVIMIPTKEFAFGERSGETKASYRRLLEQEDKFHRLIEAHLAEHGIEYIDTTPALRKVLDSDTNPYRVTIDGHPNARGHEAIAELLAARLGRN